MTTIHIIAAFMGGGLVGWQACAALTAAKVADLREALWESEGEADAEHQIAKSRWDRLCASDSAHSRCADALTTVQGKITDIRDLVDARRPIRKADIRAVLGDA